MRTRDHYFQRVIDDLFYRLRREGLARECRIDRSEFNYSLRFCIDLAHGERRYFQFSEHELRMGSEEGLRYFADVIYRDCRRFCQRAGWPYEGWYRGRAHPSFHRYESLQERYQQEMYASFPAGGWWGVDPARDEVAEQKSRDLFILGAGKKAFEIIDAGKPLPLTGSKGTKYTLHKRAAYCVERKRDRAKLCAVVPGVPLWDHLLGIKIMVENDEPHFLKIANVSPGEGYMTRAASNWF